MKKLRAGIIGLTAVLLLQTASAQNYSTGVGIRLSSSAPMVNNSVSLKHFVSDRTAIEGLLTFSNPLAIGVLAEIHTPLSATGLQWFYGAGGYVAFLKSYNPNHQRDETNPNFGAQGIVGLDYKFPAVPINLSLDWKPELNLFPDINFEPAAVGLSVRFTFGK